MGNDKVRINEGTDLRGRFFYRGQGEGAGGIPQALINKGLDLRWESSLKTYLSIFPTEVIIGQWEVITLRRDSKN